MLSLIEMTMNLLSNHLRLGARLALGFGAVMMLTVLFGVFGLLRMQAVNDVSVEIGADWLPRVAVSSRLEANVAAFRVQEFLHVLSTDAQEMETIELRLANLRKQIDTDRAAYDELVASEEERELQQRFEGLWRPYAAEHQKALDFSRGYLSGEARAVLQGESLQLYLEMNRVLAQTATLNFKGVNDASKRGNALFSQASWMISGGLAVVVALGSLLAWRITRSVVEPLKQAVQIAEKVASGDFTQAIDVSGHDETGQLLGAMHKMQGALGTLANLVRQGAEGVAAASSQIAQGNQDLSRRTEQQASALEETSAFMEHMGSSAQQNADNALVASQLATSASAVAEQGGELVSQVVATMCEIQHSSQKIGDIIGTIDGIAFQTNILALNAAVEAARAGAQGRGFAVVADEVRTLARRSAEAAKEIKQLINASVERIEQGTSLVNRAGSTMQAVVQSIRQVTSIVGDISSASQEQNAGVSQVAQALSSMDQATQQNAALVEESVSAAASLNQQAEQLLAAVSVFRVDYSHTVSLIPTAKLLPHKASALDASHTSG